MQASKGEEKLCFHAFHLSTSQPMLFPATSHQHHNYTAERSDWRLSGWDVLLQPQSRDLVGKVGI